MKVRAKLLLQSLFLTSWVTNLLLTFRKRYHHIHFILIVKWDLKLSCDLIVLLYSHFNSLNYDYQNMIVTFIENIIVIRYRYSHCCWNAFQLGVIQIVRTKKWKFLDPYPPLNMHLHVFMYPLLTVRTLLTQTHPSNKKQNFILIQIINNLTTFWDFLCYKYTRFQF
jgi:hypothetical protein